MTKLEMDQRRPSQQMDSSHSASPVTATTLPRNITNNAHEAGQGQGLQDDRSLANSGESFNLALYYTCKKYFLSLKRQKNILKLQNKIIVLEMA